MNDQVSHSGQVDHLQLICERDLADRWWKSIRTLQRWRTTGYGPAFIRLGGSIHYRLGDILDFETRMRRGGGGRR